VSKENAILSVPLVTEVGAGIPWSDLAMHEKFWELGGGGGCLYYRKAQTASQEKGRRRERLKDDRRCRGEKKGTKWLRLISKHREEGGGGRFTYAQSEKWV